ncbi:MAG: Snf7 family protein [Candidatus Hecatellaceae archaeon]
MKKIRGWDREKPLASRIGGRLSEVFARKPPLKDRVEESIYKLNSIRDRLNEFLSKLEHRDKEYLEKCMGAYSTGDEDRAKIYANECSEIRKMVKIILGSQLAVEQAALRLETIQAFGDTVAAVAPVSKLLKSLKGRLERVLPDVSYQLGEVDRSLGSLLTEFGEASPIDEQNLQPLSGEAAEILKAASLLAEQKTKEKFPSLPVEADKPRSTPSNLNL